MPALQREMETGYEHIILNENDIPVIAGTNMKVIELVLDSKSYGWSPEELYFQHPYLTLGQIYSALAYYWDHQQELDKDIKKRLYHTDMLRRNLRSTDFEVRLKSEGVIH